MECNLLRQSHLRGSGHLYKVAQKTKSCDISAGGGSMLLHQPGSLCTALLHAAQCTCHAKSNHLGASSTHTHTQTIAKLSLTAYMCST